MATTATATTNTNTNTINNDVFSSLISDIKTYTGNDPLLPWLQGIRKLRDCLSPQLLKEKLPRFLQKCAQTFQTDRRYRDDSRYIRVWLQLMDFVDDPKGILSTMESSRIGMKRSLFYQAYALYYEKIKKFDKAEKIYRLGVQNLAEPPSELQKSYDQFLQRVERRKNRRIQRASTMSSSLLDGQNKENNSSFCKAKDCVADKERVKIKALGNISQNVMPTKKPKHLDSSVNLCGKPPINKEVLKNGLRNKRQEGTETKFHESSSFHNEDTSVMELLDTAVVGQSVAESACHGPIKTKEAMNAINGMFREPLDGALVDQRSGRRQPKVDHKFEVFVDENLGNAIGTSPDQKEENLQPNNHSPNEPFEIYIDEENNEGADKNCQRDEYVNAFVFPDQKDHLMKCSEDSDAGSSPRRQLGEDTVVCRFVGSTILDEPKVENACHHGLVEPTINLKEAMDDINSMFGKPIDFVRRPRNKNKALDKLPDSTGFSILPDDNLEPAFARRARENDNKVRDRKLDSIGFSILLDDDLEHVPTAPDRRTNCGTFSILPDDDLDCPRVPPRKCSSWKLKERDLFEPTTFTKEAMDDINKMFGMPLD